MFHTIIDHVLFTTLNKHFIFTHMQEIFYYFVALCYVWLLTLINKCLFMSYVHVHEVSLIAKQPCRASRVCVHVVFKGLPHADSYNPLCT